MMQRSTRNHGCIAAPKPAIDFLSTCIQQASRTHLQDLLVFKSRISGLCGLRAARWPWSDSGRLKEGELAVSEPASASSNSFQVTYMRIMPNEAAFVVDGVGRDDLRLNSR
jgi:hypothetical protein